jgi:hypothetical protein
MGNLPAGTFLSHYTITPAAFPFGSRQDGQPRFAPVASLLYHAEAAAATMANNLVSCRGILKKQHRQLSVSHGNAVEEMEIGHRLPPHGRLFFRSGIFIYSAEKSLISACQ